MNEECPSETQDFCALGGGTPKADACKAGTAAAKAWCGLLIGMNARSCSADADCPQDDEQRANLRVRGITLSTQNCIQAGSCPPDGLGHINKHNSESSTVRTNTLGPRVTGTVTQISSRTESFILRALGCS